MSVPFRPGRLPGLYRVRSLALALVALAGLATTQALAQLTAPMVPLVERPETIVIHTDTGDHVFTVEWAVTDAERARGLMFRTEMAPDHGMVFDFFREGPVSFWMRNTLISLDMIFIRSDGTVLSIAQNTTPLSDTAVPSNGAVRYVLEVIGGTAARLSIDPGDKIDLE
ncbi:MAG: DUF192 domain-containing protein [Bauldia sp.]|nr:DUF192 domain-containing protein [Bauldia sp.]